MQQKDKRRVNSQDLLFQFATLRCAKCNTPSFHKVNPGKFLIISFEFSSATLEKWGLLPTAEQTLNTAILQRYLPKSLWRQGRETSPLDFFPGEIVKKGIGTKIAEFNGIYGNGRAMSRCMLVAMPGNHPKLFGEALSFSMH